MPKTLTPAEYKFAAEHFVKCLHNGIGVCERYKITKEVEAYELNGWILEASKLVNHWYDSIKEKK